MDGKALKKIKHWVHWKKIDIGNWPNDFGKDDLEFVSTIEELIAVYESATTKE